MEITIFNLENEGYLFRFQLEKEYRYESDMPLYK